MEYARILNPDTIRQRIRAALEEDIANGDVTTNAVFLPGHMAEATIVSKADGILSGGSIATLVFDELDPAVSIHFEVDDGKPIGKGTTIARLNGPTRSLLAGERLALNFLQRLCGIATLTHKFVEAVGGRISICDTRKTTPLWRDLEKYAVACGGGTNHRFGLYDMVMLKDTHADGAGGLAEALRQVADLRPNLTVAAEARNMEEVRAAAEAKVDLLMLDNMSEEQIAEAIEYVRPFHVLVEVTGGVTLDNISRYTKLGVDRISIGALTHSAQALDLSMRINLK